MSKLKQVAVYFPPETLARLLPYAQLRQANRLINDAVVEKLDALDGKKTIVTVTAGNSTAYVLPRPTGAQEVPLVKVTK